jgi:hypothetical protein
LFHKLREEEIKQISEDKIYYLGEKNIDTYNTFLSTLHPHPNLMLTSRKPEHKADQQPQQKASFSYDNKRKINIDKELEMQIRNKFSHLGHQVQSTPTIKNCIRIDRNISNSKRQYSSEKHMESEHRPNAGDTFYNQTLLDYRKEEVEEEVNKWRLHHKLRLDIQMAKVEANQREIKEFQYSKMKATQNAEKEHHKKVIQRKNTLLKRGEIIQLDEELRSILIRRKNKRNHDSVDCFNELPIPDEKEEM